MIYTQIIAQHLLFRVVELSPCFSLLFILHSQYVHSWLAFIHEHSIVAKLAKDFTNLRVFQVIILLEDNLIDYFCNNASHPSCQNHGPALDAELQSMVPPRKLSLQLLPLSLSLLVRTPPRHRGERTSLRLRPRQDGRRARRSRTVSTYYFPLSAANPSKAWLSQQTDELRPRCNGVDSGMWQRFSPRSSIEQGCVGAVQR